ncbi:MAG: 2-phospho-L-lactate guanylyltransferase [Nitrosarchaeum sp.]|nr:2-phospho-L-lactate guanylyltransferase [Nitrosarchaeum sp.]MBP0119693.1 2-phospho-L-lactate guanylyltransferase [Nitrosarchaeum sp.]MBP0133407.1 2-phospho-L-lactate guanylyltransferase [Nitrosarchaeum sp.]MDW7641772.1 2-phospho-L-lactate guanylyltransferase [Nitrosarchaeum sp.]
MKIAAIIPVKTFSIAKTRLELSLQQKEDLCKIMLEEILHILSISPQIEKIIIVTKEEKAIELGKKYNAVIILDNDEKNVNSAVDLADKYLLENQFHASIVLPQDIPCIKTQDIDFMLNYKIPPNFAIVVPSRRFDGTNALVRMPIDLMKTHYDEDSYKIHMNTAKEHTRNVTLVFVKRIMLDIDNMEDLKYLLEQNEKPELVEKIRNILNRI